MKRHAALVVGMLTLVALTAGGLGRDLWWDEITSLDGFALTDFVTTLTAQSGLNNHVLFNLLNNVLTRALGERSLDAWMANIAPLRAMQLLLACTTVGAAYTYARRAFGPTAAALTAFVLVTTVPFLSFATQLRGYNLSMCLAAVTLALAHRWRLRGGTGAFVALTAGLFALLYTLPSNAYVVAAFGASAVMWAARARGGDAPGSARRSGGVLLAVGAAAALAALAYRPMLAAMLDDPFLTRTPDSRAFVLTSVSPAVGGAFLSGRYLLIGVGAIGLVAAWSRRLRDEWLPLLALLIVPFLLSAARNDWPFERTFVVLAPIFAVVVAAPVAAIVDRRTTPGPRRAAVVGGFAIYLLGTCLWQLDRARDATDEALDRGEKIQHLTSNYYQSSRYRPRAVAEVVAAALRTEPLPVVLHEPVDRVALAKYLAAVGVTSYAYKGPRQPALAAGSAYEVQVVSGEADTRGAVAFATMPVDRSRYAPGLETWLPVLEAATERERTNGGGYVLSSRGPALAEAVGGHLGEVFTLERLSEGAFATDVYRVRRRTDRPDPDHDLK